MKALVAAVAFLILLCGTTNGALQAKPTPWVCELNSFFSLDAKSQFQRKTVVSGRGLVSCRNQSGFSFEIPVVADLKVELDVPRTEESAKPEVALSATSAPFVVTRDIYSIYDHYDRDQRASQNLFRSKDNEILMSLSFNGSPHGRQIKVSGLDLQYDEQAPELDDEI